MKEFFEPVHVVDDYYDGPRTGVAEFQGVRHRFRSLVWPPGEHWNSEEDRYELTREDNSGTRVIAHGVFRARQSLPDLPPGVLPPLEVQWSVEEQ